MKDILEIRKHLHQHPEIGFDTFNTANYIYDILVELGYETEYALDKRAVIAYLDLNKKKTIALRSDMDALKIKEETELDFASINGCMHACGHDVHMSILLLAAKLIKENIKDLKYNVILLFQPAEEGPLPGGAFYLKEHELLKKADAFFAYHVSPKLYVGQMGIKENEACAAPDLWELELTGVGCHASTPENGRNPILAGSEIALKLEEFYQEFKKKENVVISTTYFNSGVSMNIIKDKAYLKGTARSFTDQNRHYLHTKMEDIIADVCKKYGINYKFDFHYAYPPLHNDIKLANKMFKAASNVLGSENCLKLDKPELIGEDFAYYKEIAPICLTWIGAREKGDNYYDLHNSHFVASSKTIYLGADILLNLLKDAA